MLYFYLLGVTGSVLAFFYGSVLAFSIELPGFALSNAGEGDALGLLIYVLLTGVVWYLHWSGLRPLWPQVSDTRQSLTKLMIGIYAIAFLLGMLVSGAKVVQSILELGFRIPVRPASAQGDFVSGLFVFIVSFALWREHWTQIKIHSGSGEPAG